jgi:hypothetical protein
MLLCQEYFPLILSNNNNLQFSSLKKEKLRFAEELGWFTELNTITRVCHRFLSNETENQQRFVAFVCLSGDILSAILRQITSRWKDKFAKKNNLASCTFPRVCSGVSRSLCGPTYM